MINILLADDQKLFVNSLKTVLESTSKNFNIVGICYNGREVLHFCRKMLPDLILMDVRMPEMDGVEATEAILKIHSELKIIMLTTFNEDHYVRKALELGARGYLLKDILPEELNHAINTIMNGAVSISPAVMRYSLLNKHNQKHLDWLADLTPKEYKILRLICKGYSNQDIADEVYLAKQTVKNYVSSIYEKLNVRDRMQLMRQCINLRIFED